MANTVTQPSKTEKRLKALFCIFAVVAVIVSGAIIALNIIVSGDNMVNIVEQYLVKSDPLPEPGAQTGENSGSETGEDSPTGLFAIYGMLDGGDYNQIAAGISDGTLLEKLGGAEGIEKFTDIADSGGSIFDKIAGFSNIFSGFGSIGKVLSGEYNVVSLLLNVVDANDLIRPNTVAAAMEDAGIELPELPESQEEPASEGEDLSGEEPETSEETDISGEEELPGEAASAEAQPEDEGAQPEGAEEESAVQGVDITSAIEAALSRAENPVSGEENAETQSAAEESGENSAEEPAQEQPSEEEQTDNLYIRAFMHTKLMSEITIDSAFVYFDYYSNVKTGETWKETLKEKIYSRIDGRKQDLALLLGHAVGEEDASAVAALREALANNIIEKLTPPDQKEVSAGVRGLIGIFFSVKMALVFLILALLNLVMAFVVTRDGLDSALAAGVCLIVGGGLVMAMRLLNKYIIGDYFSASENFWAGNAFLIAGGVYAVTGLVTYITFKIIQKAKYRKIKAKFNPQQYSDMLTASDIELIQKFGLSDLVAKDDSIGRREDGTVDYYGDGRGLGAQRDFLQKQKEREENKKKVLEEQARRLNELRNRTRATPGAAQQPEDRPADPGENTDGKSDS